MARLRRSDPLEPGITRRGRGRGFEYFDDDGVRVTDPEVLERISELVIPPAWREVWICPYPMGHIQAVGIDAAGRKQYRYHDKWRERRDREKFDSMLDFARALPRLRAAVSEDLDGGGMGRDRVLAAAVRLLDRGFFRVGGEDYAAENETYGLATMQKSHVTVARDGTITFDYPAKGGKRRIQRFMDDDVCVIVKTLRRRRGGGPELLAYQRGRRWLDIRSEDVNEYVRQRSGGPFTAKDFRTWNATLLAAIALAVSGRVAAEGSDRARQRAVTRAVKEVADYLGNTPAVARASYIDPRLWDRFDEGLTIGGVLVELGEDGDISAGSLLGTSRRCWSCSRSGRSRTPWSGWRRPVRLDRGSQHDRTVPRLAAALRVAYVFSTSGHTASYKLGKMILPQLEDGTHGVEVAGMFFFDDNTYVLRAGDPLGERLGKVAAEQGILLMLCDRCAIERGLAEGEPMAASPTGTVEGVRVGCFPDLYAALAERPPDQVITL